MSVDSYSNSEINEKANFFFTKEVKKKLYYGG